MSNKVCPKCNVDFKYISVLKRHLENSVRCSANDNYINNTINNINTNSNTDTHLFTCNDCNKNFKYKTSIYRHKSISKCAINKANIINQNIQEQQNNNTIPTTSNSASATPTPQPITQSQTNINTNTNSHNTNNTIINNNNNTIIQHINPFGFEDVRTIPISEMKAILNSGTEAGLHIIKAIYNKIENKNFYKPNISRSEVACLNEDLKLTIYKSREFADAFFDRCIALLHHMLYLCKHEFTSTSIKYIYDNIEYIESTMRTEIYEKKLQSIIESEFRNNNLDTKDRIKNFIKKIKEETDSKDNSLLQIKNTLDLKEEKNNEYKKSITTLELNNLFGDPKVILGLKKEEIILNLRISRFEESMFYNFWIERLNNIKKYVMNNKTSKIGDIINLKQEENKIMSMLEIINKRVDNNRGDDYLDLNINNEFRLD